MERKHELIKDTCILPSVIFFFSQPRKIKGRVQVSEVQEITCERADAFISFIGARTIVVRIHPTLIKLKPTFRTIDNIFRVFPFSLAAKAAVGISRRRGG